MGVVRSVLLGAATGTALLNGSESCSVVGGGLALALHLASCTRRWARHPNADRSTSRACTSASASASDGGSACAGAFNFVGAIGAGTSDSTRTSNADLDPSFDASSSGFLRALAIR